MQKHLKRYVCLNCGTIYSHGPCPLCHQRKSTRVNIAKEKLFGITVTWIKKNNLKIGLLSDKEFPKKFTKVLEKNIKCRFLIAPTRNEVHKIFEYLQKFSGEQFKFKDEAAFQSRYSIVGYKNKPNDLLIILNENQIEGIEELEIIVPFTMSLAEQIKFVNTEQFKELNGVIKNAVLSYDRKICKLVPGIFDLQINDLINGLSKKLLQSYAFHKACSELYNALPLEATAIVKKHFKLTSRILPTNGIDIGTIFYLLSEIADIAFYESYLKNKKLKSKITKEELGKLKQIILGNPQLKMLLKLALKIKPKSFQKKQVISYYSQLFSLASKLKPTFMGSPLTLNFINLREHYLDLIVTNPYPYIQGVGTEWDYIHELSAIEKKDINLEYIWLAKQTKLMLLEHIITFKKDKQAYVLLKKYAPEAMQFYENMHDKIIKANPNTDMKKVDILSPLKALMRASFMLGESTDFFNWKALFEYKCNENNFFSEKLLSYFFDFAYFEDYEKLKYVLELFPEINLRKDPIAKLEPTLFKVTHLIAEAIIHKIAIPEKIKQSIDLLFANFGSNFTSVIANFVKKTEKEAMEMFLRGLLEVYIASTCTNTKRSISHLQKAETYFSLQEQFEGEVPYSAGAYFKLKTNAILALIMNNQNDLKNIINKIKGLPFNVNSHKTLIQLIERGTTKLSFPATSEFDFWLITLARALRQTPVVEEENILESIKYTLTAATPLIESHLAEALWLKRGKPRPVEQREKIAKALLIAILSSANGLFYKEPTISAGRTDIIYVKDNVQLPIEVKVPNSLAQLKTGLKEINFHTQKLRCGNGLYVVFDIRKKQTKIPINYSIHEIHYNATLSAPTQK